MLFSAKGFEHNIKMLSDEIEVLKTIPGTYLLPPTAFYSGSNNGAGIDVVHGPSTQKPYSDSIYAIHLWHANTPAATYERLNSKDFIKEGSNLAARALQAPLKLVETLGFCQ